MNGKKNVMEFVTSAEAAVAVSREAGRKISTGTLLGLYHGIFSVPGERRIRWVQSNILPLISLYWREWGYSTSKDRPDILKWILGKGLRLPFFAQPRKLAPERPSEGSAKNTAITEAQFMDMLAKFEDRLLRKVDTRTSALITASIGARP